MSEFVDADLLARSLAHSEPAAITAGRAVLRRLDELAAGRNHLVFLWLASADVAVARVTDRVRLGGHAVPEETVRRRYRSGVRNFFSIYQPLTTTWRMYDNSTDALRLVASGVGTRALTVNDVDLWRHINAEAGREDQ